ncbi:MAG: CsgG/HfaB family protein [Planctomycetota bacterium]|jgi:curli biogenesis system outer membrane secretion channel CsgG
MNVKAAITTLLFAVILVLNTQCSGADSKTADKSDKDSEKTEPAKNILTKKISEIPGPKRTVSVGNFTAIGSFKAQYGDMDIGGGLGAMMTTALVESDRFIVLERANINQVLAEQEMKAQGLSKGTAAPDTGKITGSQLLIYGSVTEFGSSNRGGGFSFGFRGFGGRNAPSIGASPQWKKGAVTMDIRVVDSTTGQIIKNFKAREKVSSRSWSLSAGINQISVGNNHFVKTPLGDAARRCITKVVEKFARITAKRPWSGMVVDVEGGTVYINAGSVSGIKKGDTFKIMRITKTFTDPRTGQVIGQKKKELGRVAVTEVMEKLSTADYVPLAEEKPKRGDLILQP